MKRIISLILCAIMVLTLLPFSALAETGEVIVPPAQNEEIETPPVTDVTEGETPDEETPEVPQAAPLPDEPTEEPDTSEEPVIPEETEEPTEEVAEPAEEAAPAALAPEEAALIAAIEEAAAAAPAELTDVKLVSDVTLTQDLKIPAFLRLDLDAYTLTVGEGVTLTVAADAALVVPEGATLANLGSVAIAGAYECLGTASGNEIVLPQAEEETEEAAEEEAEEAEAVTDELDAYAAPASGITITFPTAGACVFGGETLQAIANFEGGNDGELTMKWSVDSVGNYMKVVNAATGQFLAENVSEAGDVTIKVEAVDKQGKVLAANPAPVMVTVRVLPNADAVLLFKDDPTNGDLNEDDAINGKTITKEKPLDTFSIYAVAYPELDADDDADRPITWKSSSNSIATITDDGEITVARAGTVVFTATSEDHVKAAASVTYVFTSAVNHIKYNPALTDDKLFANTSVQLTAYADADDKQAVSGTWSVDPEYAPFVRITSGGLMTGLDVTGTGKAKVQFKPTGSAAEDAPLVFPNGDDYITIVPTAKLVNLYLTNDDGTKTGDPINGTNVQRAVAKSPFKLFAEVVPASEGLTATWKSSDTSIATIDESSGEVTAQKIGTVTITATSPDGKATGSVRFTFANISNGVTIKHPVAGEQAPSNEPITLTSGKSIQLIAEFVDPQPSNKSVTWRLEGDYAQYVKISASGLLTALNVPKTIVSDDSNKKITVVCTPKDGGDKATFSVITITPAVSGIDVMRGDADSVVFNGKTAYLATGSGEEFTAVLNPTGAGEVSKVQWKSSNPSVASVADEGIFEGETATVTANKAGTATITAKYETKSVTFKVQVGAYATALEIQYQGKALVADQPFAQNQAIALTAKLTGDDLTDKSVTWKLDDEDIAYASISTGGRITVKAIPPTGELTVTAEATANPSATDTKTIKILAAVSSVTIRTADRAYSAYETIIYNTSDDGLDASLAKGLELTGVVMPSTAPQAGRWTSSNPNIASFDEESPTSEDNPAKLIAHVSGTTTVTFTTADGTKRASVKVKVCALATSVTIAPATIEVTSGSSVQLAATVEPTGVSQSVAWSLQNTTDSAYCSVSATGLVKAKDVYVEKAVTIVATAKDGSGVSGKATVTIKPVDGKLWVGDDTATIDYTNQTIPIENGDTVTLAARLTGDDTNTVVAADFRLTPTTGAVEIAETTNGAHVYRAVKPSGTSTVLVTFNDETVKVTFRVVSKVSGIEIDSNPSGQHNIVAGQRLGMTATLTPERPTTPGVIWSIPSEMQQYATIGAGGLVTTKKATIDDTGTPFPLTVTATAKDGSGMTAEYEITVLPEATSVEIYQDSATGDLLNGTTLSVNMAEKTYVTLVHKVLPYDPNDPDSGASQDVVWSPQYTSGVAYVDSTGNVVINRAGTVTITARTTDGSNKSASFKLVVYNMPNDITPESRTGKYEMCGGSTLTFDVGFGTVTPSSKRVKWWLDSADADAATISASGVLRAKSVLSETTVTVHVASAEFPAIQGQCVVAITPAISSIRLKYTYDDKDGAPVTEDVTGKTIVFDAVNMDSISLEALVFNVAADDVSTTAPLNWSTSNANIANVSDAGMVTAGTNTGTAIITVKALDGSNRSATVRITVTRGLRGVTLAPESYQVASKQNLRITASFDPADAVNRALKWSLAPADKLYASISASGVLTAKNVTSPQTVRVTAVSAANPEVTNFVEITIMPAASSLIIKQGAENVTGKTCTINLSGAAQELTFMAYAYPSNAAQEFTWSSGNPRIATVTDNGDGSATVQAVGTALGTSVITAKSKDGSNRTATVTVNVTKLAESITLVPAAYVIAAGKYTTIKATVLPAGLTAANSAVTWKLSADSTQYATISASGMLTAKANVMTEKLVTVRAIAKTNESVIGSCQVTIKPVVSSVSIFDNATKNVTGTTQTIDLTSGTNSVELFSVSAPSGANQDCTWTSGSAYYATVDPVTGSVSFTGKVGKVTITATAKDGSRKYGSVTFDVVKRVSEINLTSANVNNEVLQGRSLLIKAEVLPSGATNKTVAWNLDPGDEAYATISAYGYLTAKAGTAGETVTVTATAKDGSGISESISINIVDVLS